MSHTHNFLPSSSHRHTHALIYSYTVIVDLGQIKQRSPFDCGRFVAAQNMRAIGHHKTYKKEQTYGVHNIYL